MNENGGKWKGNELKYTFYKVGATISHFHRSIHTETEEINDIDASIMCGKPID